MMNKASCSHTARCIWLNFCEFHYKHNKL